MTRQTFIKTGICGIPGAVFGRFLPKEKYPASIVWKNLDAPKSEPFRATLDCEDTAKQWVENPAWKTAPSDEYWIGVDPAHPSNGWSWKIKDPFWSNPNSPFPSRYKFQNGVWERLT